MSIEGAYPKPGISSPATAQLNTLQSGLDALSARVTALEGTNLPVPSRWFASDSLWNTPIENNPAILSNSDDIVDTILNGIPGVNDAEGTPTAPTNDVIKFHVGANWDQYDYEHPVFFAKITDTIKTIVVTSGFGANGIEILAPADAWVSEHPPHSEGGDNAMAIVQPNGDTYEFWGVTEIAETTITAEWADGPNNYYTGSGWNEVGAPATITLGRMSLGAGVLRYDEMMNGIFHALDLVTYNYSGYISPASAGNQGDRRFVDRTDVPKMGMRLRLNLTDNEINALPDHLQNLATCCRDYGLYVGDTGGGGLHADNSNKAAWTYVAVSTGVPVWEGTYTWDLTAYVDMATKLQVLDTT